MTPGTASSGAFGRWARLRDGSGIPVLRPLHALNRQLASGQQWLFKRWLGVTTSGRVELDDSAGAERIFFEGCEWLPVRRALRQMRSGQSDVLVDLGCGKGQALPSRAAGRSPAWSAWTCSPSWSRLRAAIWSGRG